MVFSKNTAFPFFPHNFPARLTELQKGQMTCLEGKLWVRSTASIESNLFLSSSPTTRQHTIAFIDQRVLMKSALAVVYASMTLWTALVHIRKSLQKSVTFYQQLIWYVEDSRPWVPFFTCFVSCLCILPFAHFSRAAVRPSALGAGVHSSARGLTYSLHSQSSGLGMSNGISAAPSLQARRWKGAYYSVLL